MVLHDTLEAGHFRLANFLFLLYTSDRYLSDKTKERYMKNSSYIHGQYPAPKSNQVGLFYFLWLGEHGRHKPYDVSKIVAEHPDAGYHPKAEYWGGYGVYHHWGEPFYGYYYSDDEWVVRRHMKLILQSGIDFLYFDTTNAVIYEKNAKLVLRVLQEYHDDGWRIPQVMFYTNTRSGETTEKIYETIYKPNYCPDTWYYIDGKPAIIAFEEELSDEMREFFTVKIPQWPNEPDKVGGWPWMDFTRPQRIFEDVNGRPECINVSIAQHPQLRFGDSVLYGETGNCGRAFHDGTNDPDPEAYKYCGNMIEQFERALEAAVPYTLETGWNEWIAGYWGGIPERPVMFVDCANYEYSRDIEMMRGGYFDNYYVKLCEYVAKLKGKAPEVCCPVGECVTFHGFSDGAMHRNHPGYGCTYENCSGRYSLKSLTVENGADEFRFTLETSETIDRNDTSGTFLQILVNPDAPGNGEYACAINTSPDFAAGMTTTRTPAGEISVPMSCSENVLSVSVPKSVMNGDVLYLKACDSRDPIVSVEDFYDHGDVIPMGRADFCVILK